MLRSGDIVTMTVLMIKDSQLLEQVIKSHLHSIYEQCWRKIVKQWLIIFFNLGPACEVRTTGYGYPDQCAERLARPNKNILFLGNSYTYGNDLPGMVRNLASAAGWQSEWQLVNFSWRKKLFQERVPLLQWLQLEVKPWLVMYQVVALTQSGSFSKKNVLAEHSTVLKSMDQMLSGTVERDKGRKFWSHIDKPNFDPREPWGYCLQITMWGILLLQRGRLGCCCHSRPVSETKLWCWLCKNPKFYTNF